MAQYPDIFTTLKPFDGDFDAFKLQADNCDVIFASYPKGTSIPPIIMKLITTASLLVASLF